MNQIHSLFHSFTYPPSKVMRGNTRNLQNNGNGNQEPGTPPGQNMFDSVDPFDKLCGVYYGSSMATVNGRVLFGGCTKASSQDACDQGGFFVKDFFTQVVNCDERCEPNTCRGADIFITAQSNGVSWSSASSTTTMGMVEITVKNGESKDGTDCQGGGNNLPIPYDCEATVRGGATSFSCFSQEIDGPFVGGGNIPAGVLRVDATLSQSGVLNWQASALNPTEFAPSAGELQQRPNEYIKSGNIMGKKFEDMGDCHAHSAGAVTMVDLNYSDRMVEEMCSGYGVGR